MSNSRLNFLLLILLLLSGFHVFAQDSIPVETIRMRQLTVDDGLSQGFVYGGCQDKDGFMWFATMDGLNKYDGYHFIVYKHDPENPYSLPENSINTLAQDKYGNLWIGTLTMGLYIMDKKTERFYPAPIVSSSGSNSNNGVIRLNCEEDLLCLITTSGLNMIRIKQKLEDFSGKGLKENMEILQSFPLRIDFDNVSSSGKKFAINTAYNGLQLFTPDKNGSHWTNETLTAKDLGQELFDVYTEFALADSGNTLLIFNRGIIYSYDFKTHATTRLEAGYGNNINLYKLFIIDNKVYACGNDKAAGNILFELDLESKKLKKFHPENNARILLPMFKDHTGMLWIRTDAVGLCLMNTRLQGFKTSTYLGRSILGTNHIFVTPYNGNVSEGVFEFSTKERRLKKLFPTSVFMQEKNTSLFDFIDHRNRFWRVDAKNNPYNALLQYDTVSKKLSRFDHGFKYILHMFEDRQNNLWVVHRGGAAMLDIFITRLEEPYEKTGTSYHFPAKQLIVDGRFIAGYWQDSKNVFWLPTDIGLFSLDPSQKDEKKIWRYWKNMPGDNSSLSSDKIISICPDPKQPQQYLWLGTRGSGFNRFDMATGKCMRFSEKDGLANNVAYDILPDDLGHLWISTNMGLSCFTLPAASLPKGSFRNFTEEDGIAGNEFNSFTGRKLSTGELMFNGVKGNTWFYPAEVLQQQDTVPVSFISLSVNNKILQWQHDSAVIDGNIAYSKKITLSHDQNIFSISFSSMDFRNEKGKRYSWKLEGFDKNWTEPSQQHEVTYTNLSPGTYTFYVKASNTDGFWNEKGNAIQIVIVPAWYQTWLFKIAIMLLVAGGVYAFYRYRLKQALKLQAIRNNIASDLHDEIGSTLSSISISSAVIRKKINHDSPEANNLLNQISSNTDNMMEAMSDIVWAVNTKNDRFENVVNRMRAFAIEILEPEAVLLNMQVSKQLDQVVLNMQQRKNLYLLFKEAINNIAKYAACKNVWVDINLHAGKICMKIKDDGKGFSTGLSADEPVATMGGNGLKSMQKRANELNGKLTVEAAIGQGTEVVLEFPT